MLHTFRHLMSDLCDTSD